jgi:hypothetical protein
MVVYDLLRNNLQLGTQTDFFYSTTSVSFRQKIREIYSTKMAVGARHYKAVAKKKKAGKQVVGRKEKGTSSKQQSQNLLTPTTSKENTQVSQSSTSLQTAISLTQMSRSSLHVLRT